MVLKYFSRETSYHFNILQLRQSYNFKIHYFFTPLLHTHSFDSLLNDSTRDRTRLGWKEEGGWRPHHDMVLREAQEGEGGGGGGGGAWLAWVLSPHHVHSPLTCKTLECWFISRLVVVDSLLLSLTFVGPCPIYLPSDLSCKISLIYFLLVCLSPPLSSLLTLLIPLSLLADPLLTPLLSPVSSPLTFLPLSLILWLLSSTYLDYLHKQDSLGWGWGGGDVAVTDGLVVQHWVDSQPPRHGTAGHVISRITIADLARGSPSLPNIK